jgi:tellurite resistance protein TerC
MADISIWVWIGFSVFVTVLLILDLTVFHRKAHVVSLKEAAGWYVIWVSLAVFFYLGIFMWLGADKATEFLTGYVIEVSLSVDNVFVWLIIFSTFAVPNQYQHRVLFLGILGAIVLRGLFIATGVTLLNMFGWLIFVFGAFLIFTGLKLAFRKKEELDPEKNIVLRLARRFIPVTEGYEGQKFFVRRNGVLMATPLFMVLIVVEATDLVFAVDSVPAILAISRDPFIVWTSNVFAILGLRALFFLVAGVLRYFRYLDYGLSAVLCFVGIKMVVSDFYHVPTAISLGTVAGILSVTMLVSYLAARRELGSKSDSVDVTESDPQTNNSSK